MLVAEVVIAAVVALLVVLTVMRSVRIVPQARARNVERLGRYRKTLEPGLNFVIPMIDRVKPMIDLREQVVSFNGAPVITEDNLVVLIDTVLFFQVTDPRAADYEIVNYIQAIEQITATMLRSVIGSMDLEQTLTSRDKINALLRGVLDDASGKWGIRVTRVEIKAIDPPKSVKDAMEKQMRAEREKRAAILTAEGVRQSKILTAEGEKQSAILSAEGAQAERKILTAEGEAQAIETVFQAVHDNDPDPKLLAYQYLQTLPQLAQGPGNTFWVIPSEVTTALRSVASAFGGGDAEPAAGPARKPRPRREPPAVPAGSARRRRSRPGPGPASDGAPAPNGTAGIRRRRSALGRRRSGDSRRPERHARRRHPRDQLRRPAGVHRSGRPRQRKCPPRPRTATRPPPTAAKRRARTLLEQQHQRAADERGDDDDRQQPHREEPVLAAVIPLATGRLRGGPGRAERPAPRGGRGGRQRNPRRSRPAERVPPPKSLVSAARARTRRDGRLLARGVGTGSCRSPGRPRGRRRSGRLGPEICRSCVRWPGQKSARSGDAGRRPDPAVLGIGGRRPRLASGCDRQSERPSVPATRSPVAGPARGRGIQDRCRRARKPPDPPRDRCARRDRRPGDGVVECAARVRQVMVPVGRHGVRG